MVAASKQDEHVTIYMSIAVRIKTTITCHFVGKTYNKGSIPCPLLLIKIFQLN